LDFGLPILDWGFRATLRCGKSLSAEKGDRA
jgi:hypothetical protein